MRFFLIVPKKDIPRYTFEHDRAYFSKPVEVVLSCSDLSTKLVQVVDPVRNCRFPVLATDIKPEYLLTKKQRAAIGGAAMRSEQQRVSKQAAANCDRFEALTVGATFGVYGRNSYRLLERYEKIGGDHVRAISEFGGVWPFAFTEGSGSSVILVPDGAYSIAPYDCDSKWGGA